MWPFHVTAVTFYNSDIVTRTFFHARQLLSLLFSSLSGPIKALNLGFLEHESNLADGKRSR